MLYLFDIIAQKRHNLKFVLSFVTRKIFSVFST